MNNKAFIYSSFGSPLDCLALEEAPLPPLSDHAIRVRMSIAPINPSDLIPITGAYLHRITLPMVAGYEGVGQVIEAPVSREHLLGKRVLPLRGPGTWQRFVDCDPDFAVLVPEWIDDRIAARGYINPMAALRMLIRWPVKGKRVLLSGAGSTCADLLGHWALLHGAFQVTGIFRSSSRAHRMRSLGIDPVPIEDSNAIQSVAAASDLTFDSLGGTIGSEVLGAMRASTVFVGYGLLSGQQIRPSKPPKARFERFHLRDELERMQPDEWQRQFDGIWALLPKIGLPEVRIFPFQRWKTAVEYLSVAGSTKPMLDFNDSDC